MWWERATSMTLTKRDRGEESDTVVVIVRMEKKTREAREGVGTC